MHTHEVPTPVPRPLVTPGTLVLMTLTAIGLCFAAWRFVFGISSITNLDQQHPWGIWIAIDVATGVALAAGGFMTSALAHIFHREHFHAVVRPALLTAMLGYTFVGLGLMVDLGKYYNIWHPSLPMMWSGHSVLFEVGMCVMCYLTVLYLEFAPIVCERLMTLKSRPGLVALAKRLHTALQWIMPLLIIAGVVLSSLHQSSLGTLMVLAKNKMHMLWWTPVSPLLFLLSAFMVGYPMVIFEGMYAAWSLRLKPEMHVLSPLARFVPFFLMLYLAVKLGDLVVRDAYVYLAPSAWTLESTMWTIEVVGGVIVPLLMLLNRRVRENPKALFFAALLVVLGVALNRINVFLVAFNPVYPVRSYFPSIGEVAVTVGLISLLILVYRVFVTVFPVITHSEGTQAA